MESQSDSSPRASEPRTADSSDPTSDPVAEASPQPDLSRPSSSLEPGPATPGRWRLTPAFQAALIPMLAVVTALLLGALVILASGGDVLLAYRGLWEGSLGRPESISETLVSATPYILAGLSVALAFKAGLFNIGAEGQIGVGALGAAWVGYALTGVPWPLHVLLAILAGCLGGLIWGAIPGYLKARTGAHEVIVTIMLNYVAIQLTSFLLSGPMKDPSRLIAVAQTPKVLESARIPTLVEPFRAHWGLVLAILMAVGVWWLLKRTTVGFEIRTVGSNPNAARYAGIQVGPTIVLTMGLAGMLSGLAGAGEVLGLNYYHTPGFSVGYGFDAIAVALLGKSHPIGVLPAALLFGALRAGSARMQFLAQIPIDIISVIQALVLIFVAAEQVTRWIYRVKPGGLAGPETPSSLAASWRGTER